MLFSLIKKKYRKECFVKKLSPLIKKNTGRNIFPNKKLFILLNNLKIDRIFSLNTSHTKHYAISKKKKKIQFLSPLGSHPRPVVSHFTLAKRLSRLEGRAELKRMKAPTSPTKWVFGI